MDEEARDNFERKLRGLDSRLKARVDEALIDLKRLYGVMRDEDKAVLRSWIEQLVPLRISPAGCLRGEIQVQLKYALSPDEDIEVVGVPVLAIKNALEHWERGEAYTPTTAGELGIG